MSEAQTAPRLIITAGEPAGVGPELCARIAMEAWPAALTVAGDPQLIAERARALGLALEVIPTRLDADPLPHRPGQLPVLPVPLAATVRAGVPDPANAGHVLTMLERATLGCLAGRYDALVTAPVHKGVINAAGTPFSGHTEFLAALCGETRPLMLLAAPGLRVALVTTHLPLRAVADAITPTRLELAARTLCGELRLRFGIARPRVLVCGLNPHAGEDGHLGREEIEVIAPTLERLRDQGLDLIGPLPADTVFTPPRLAEADAVLAMYHDQGLPVLKHLGFGKAVNITLGLPIVRTSVDHGTALEIAGSGRADPGSLRAAIECAITLANGGADRG